MNISDARAQLYAEDRAKAAGLDENTAGSIAHRVMTIWDPEYTKREWNHFIDEEIARQEPVLSDSRFHNWATKHPHLTLEEVLGADA